jgi:hypothetical protein
MKDSWVFTNKVYGWVAVEAVEFIDIEDYPYGDAMRFLFNNEEFVSDIRYGSYPG